MSTSQTKVLVMIVLLVAAVGLLYYQFTKPIAPTGTAAIAPQPDAGAATTPPGTADAIAPASPAGGAKAAAPAQAPITVDTINTLLAQIEEVDFTYEARGRDPMTPLVGPLLREGTVKGPRPDARLAVQVARSMKVTGIMWDKANPLAVVDDDVVWKGYEFVSVGRKEYPPGIVVDSIGADHVILRVEETLITLELQEP